MDLPAQNPAGKRDCAFCGRCVFCCVTTTRPHVPHAGGERRRRAFLESQADGARRVRSSMNRLSRSGFCAYSRRDTFADIASPGRLRKDYST